MAESDREHAVLNIYGEDTIRTVANAVDAARDSHGAADTSEAVEMMAVAYTGRRMGDE